MARALGVEHCGGALLALARFAHRVEGGLDILLGEDRQANHNHEEDENYTLVDEPPALALSARAGGASPDH